MPRMNDQQVKALGCRQCDFYQRQTQWCFRTQCTALDAPDNARRKEAFRNANKRSADTQKRKRAKHCTLMPDGSSSQLSAEENDKRMVLYRQGLSDVAIARQLGLRSSVTIMCWRNKRNLPPNRQTAHNRTTEETNRIRMEAYQTFGTDIAAADSLGISESTFQSWRRRSGIPSKRKAPSGT